MIFQSVTKWLGVQSVAALIGLTAATAQPATDYQPKVGQQGKDVVWVPSPDALVNRMLDLAQVTPADYVIDLGSGDGRTVIAAAKRGAKALGIEYEQGLVELATRNATEAGVNDRASFMKADLFETDFSQATVLTMFLLPEINLRLRPKILDLRPGTRVVSNTFTMGDWVPDESAEAPAADCKTYCKALFWIVPAKVDGRWQLKNGEVALEQKYQTFSGTVKLRKKVHPITDGRLKGQEITFTAGGKTFSGRVNGSVMEVVSGSGQSKRAWRATKI
jgi:hypothetical protein